mgnify:CR=1 FL=1
MTKDQLATATLDAIKARAIELESPLSDEDAAALGAMMMASDAEVGKVTEKKFNSTMEQLKTMPKEQFDGMLMMAKMMGGGGVDAMAEQMAAAMGGAMGGGFGGGEMGYGMMPLFDENDVPPPPPYTPVQPREGRGGGGGGGGGIRASDAMVEEEEEKKLRLLAEAVQRKTGKIHATLAAGNEQEVMEEQSRTSSVGNMDGSQQILSDLPQTLAGAADHISER